MVTDTVISEVIQVVVYFSVWTTDASAKFEEVCPLFVDYHKNTLNPVI